jgi:hypothetical protein
MAGDCPRDGPAADYAATALSRVVPWSLARLTLRLRIVALAWLGSRRWRRRQARSGRGKQHGERVRSRPLWLGMQERNARLPGQVQVVRARRHRSASESAAFTRGCRTKPSEKTPSALAEVHARATVRDHLIMDQPPATDQMAVFGSTLRSDPADSPGVCATASRGSDTPETAAACDREARSPWRPVTSLATDPRPAPRHGRVQAHAPAAQGLPP